MQYSFLKIFVLIAFLAPSVGYARQGALIKPRTSRSVETPKVGATGNTGIGSPAVTRQTTVAEGVVSANIVRLLNRCAAACTLPRILEAVVSSNGASHGVSLQGVANAKKMIVEALANMKMGLASTAEAATRMAAEKMGLSANTISESCPI